jgi:uncharacterized protein YjbI with pentapeptide repeats
MIIFIIALVTLINSQDTETIMSNSLGINNQNVISLPEVENAEKSEDKICPKMNENPCPCFINDKNCYNYEINKADLNEFKEFGKCSNGPCDLKNVDLQGKNSTTSFSLKYDVDLSGADLSCANLSGAVFKNANFSNANLKGAQFPQTSLENCNFQNAKLDFAKFNNAKIFKCDFRGASLLNTNFFQADLSESDLSYTIICKTIFERANLAYTSFYNSVGSNTVGYGINAGDNLFTNFCCSIKRDGTLNYQGCDRDNSSRNPTTSLNKCLDAVESLDLDKNQIAKLAPEGLPANIGATSFISKKFQFPLPREFARCNFDITARDKIALSKQDQRLLEKPAPETLYKNTRAAEASEFRKTKG